LELKPNLFLIGAPKTGSYSMWYYLSKHPEICMCKDKEPHIFSELNDNYREALLATQFSHYKGEAIIGEASLYIPEDENAERVFQMCPDAKFIVTLRDPIDRLLSNYQYRLGRGEEKRELSEIFKNGLNESLIDASLYYKHLNAFLKYYPKDAFLIITTENFQNDFEATLNNIFKFINVDANVNIENEGKLNVTMSSTSLFNKIFRWNKGSKNWNRPNITEQRSSLLPDFIRNYLSTKGIKESKLERKKLENLLKGDPFQSVIKALQNDTKALERCFDIDLSNWVYINKLTKGDIDI